MVEMDPDHRESLFLSENASPHEEIMQNLCLLAPSEKLCLGRSLNNEAILGGGGGGGGGFQQTLKRKICKKKKKKKN
jgi:hypothetical protein